MDLATIVGLVLCFGFTIYGIISGDGFGVIGSFIDPGSIAITIGGSFGACLTMNKLPDFVNGLKGFTLAIKDKKVDNADTIRKIIELSNLARKEGLLALEEAAEGLDDEFLKKGDLPFVPD